jgi:uncharacterized RDD family membrane protein YckC
MLDAPQSVGILDTPVPQLELASSGQRLFNYFLDLIFNYIAAFCTGLLLYFIGMGDFLEQVNGTLFGLALMILYYVPQEALFGWTLGKLITRTRVVSETGEGISFGQAVGRTLCRFIPFEAFSFMGGDKPVGWHDKFSKTRVISVKKKND